MIDILRSQGKISIIIAAYNCEKYIAKSVKSILDQTYLDIEVLVCDDGSTDGTFERVICIEDNRLRVFRNTENKGVVWTKNMLMRESNGRYIAFQDADDWSDHHRLERQLAVLRDLGLKVVATGGKLIFDDKKHKDLATGDDMIIKEFGDGDMPFIMPSLMFDREVIDKIGIFEEHFNRLFGEDLYWIGRVLELFPIYYLSSSLYYYRYNMDSITNTFTSEEKLFSIELVRELMAQRKKSGTDWLDKGEFDNIQEFVSHLVSKKKQLSEKYRILAAKQIDLKKLDLAFKYLTKSFALYPYSFTKIYTLFYLIRSYYGKIAGRN